MERRRATIAAGVTRLWRESPEPSRNSTSRSATPISFRNSFTSSSPASTLPTLRRSRPRVLNSISACRFWLTLLMTFRLSTSGRDWWDARTVVGTVAGGFGAPFKSGSSPGSCRRTRRVPETSTPRRASSRRKTSPANRGGSSIASGSRHLGPFWGICPQSRTRVEPGLRYTVKRRSADSVAPLGPSSPLATVRTWLSIS